MTFGEKMLGLRKREGLSQEQLAEKLKVSRQAISRWEMGSAMPDSMNLLQISKLFGVSADYLLHDEFESDRDIPVVKQTTNAMEKERNRQIALVVLIGLHAFALLITFVCMIVLRAVILGMLGIGLSLLNIIVFEVVFWQCKQDEDARHYRRKYYQLSVWLFSYFPIRGLVSAFWVLYPRPYALFWKEGSIITVYLIVCLSVTLMLMKKISRRAKLVIIGTVVIVGLLVGAFGAVIMREVGMTDVYTDVISTYIYRK